MADWPGGVATRWCRLLAHDPPATGLPRLAHGAPGALSAGRGLGLARRHLPGIGPPGQPGCRLRRLRSGQRQLAGTGRHPPRRPANPAAGGPQRPAGRWPTPAHRPSGGDQSHAIGYVEADGTGIPMVARELAGRQGQQADGTAKTRAVKPGCVGSQTTTDAAGQPLRDRQSTSYVGTLQPVASFAPLLRAEARRRGLGTAQKIVPQLLIFLAPREDFTVAWTASSARREAPCEFVTSHSFAPNSPVQLGGAHQRLGSAPPPSHLTRCDQPPVAAREEGMARWELPTTYAQQARRDRRDLVCDSVPRRQPNHPCTSASGARRPGTGR